MNGSVKPIPRVVLDTNVLMAARFNPGSSSARIIDMCIGKECTPIVSWKLRREMESILKRGNAGEKFQEKFEEFLSKAEVIKIDREIPLVMEDPDDNKFLNCALFGKADYLVTSDEHLLKFGDYLGVRILKPSEFLWSIGLGGSSRRPRRRTPRKFKRFRRDRTRGFRTKR